MVDQVIGVTIKGIGDFSDVVSNVGSVQKALTKLKLPDKLGDNLNKNISNFMKEYERYQKKVAEGIHTKGDQNAVNKSLNSMLNSYEKIIKDFSKISEKDFKDIFNLDTGDFQKFQQQIRAIEADIKKIKLDPKALVEPINKIKELTSAKRLFGNGTGFDKLTEAFNDNDFLKAKEAIQEIDGYLSRFGSKMKPEKLQEFQNAWGPLKTKILDADAGAEELYQDFNRVSQAMAELGGRGSRELQDMANGLRNTDDAAKSVVAELKQLHANEFDFNRQAADIDRQIQSYFGLSQMIRKVGDIAKDAFATVKELDKAMTQTAVVTNFSVGDMWDMLPTYTAQANQLGSTIKDVYEAATLYYQQGLNTNQAMGLANETLKMARIAGLDAAEATNMMTAALRGFNMEINQMSAQKVNDIYSELAAITASDTKEIGSAMERTASIANSANMDFATTSAFLAQMIETTREAPENLGTAMKTIVARFQEMKQDPTKLIDSEGVAMDANKVDKALKTIGVNLMNTKGEFRDLDDVFLDIASKWDSLSQGQQRYIATIAAGSRQQSRFIAMMSDYERTMELVDAANNSAGASQRQFEKTLDSMEAKLNMLKNAWNQFTMGLMNNQILKFGVDRLTDAFTIVNKFIDILGSIPPNPFEGITKSVLTLVTTLGMLNFGKKASRGLIMGGAGWWKGETSFTGGFSQGWKQSGQAGFFANRKHNIAAAQGKADAAAYNAAVQNEMTKGGFTKAIAMAWKTKGQNFDFTNTFGAAFGQFSGERFAASWSADIEAEIIRVLNSAIKDSAKIGEVAGKEFKQNLIAQLKAGNISGEQLISSVHQVSGEDISNLGVNAKQFKDGAEAATNFGTRIGLAGDSLLRFGTILQGTPLAPFGSMLSTVGMAVSNFGSAFAKAATIFTNGMNMVVQSEITGSLATAGLAGGFKALWGALLESPLFPIVAALLALYGTYKLLDAAIVSNKEQLEAATDAAAAASEAYDSAKQETSELADAIDTIRETDSAFDGLVAGTAEFNEQLVTANEQIMALIDKYPMLNDSQYLSTDKNGLMHINEAGFKAVKEYQKQIQARASAMNLIQTADLNALENQQKAQQLRNSIKTNMSDDEQDRILRNADLLEQRAEAETKLAHLNAIRVGLVDKEIADQEKLASIYVDQYEAKKQVAEAEVEAMGKHDIRQAYADYHGYTYDKSTKKIKDVEGNEIDYDDAAIKDEVIEQTVMLDFEANASSLEGILHSLDRDFSKTLDDAFENSSTFISDVLSNNAEANEDLLQQVLDNPEQLNDFVERLSTKELAAVLGASEEAVENNVDSYKQELENKLLTNAQNIIDTNAQANGELAAMLAQAQGKTANEVLISKNTQNGLIEQVKNFTSEQRNTLLNIGKILQESVGSEAMTTFVSGLSNIYRSNNEELITATQNWVDGVNWETATSRLKGYNEAINMTTENTEHLGEESVKQLNSLGQSLLNSQDEANLLGEAFEEFYNSTDFQEMAENMDKFVDSSGQLNAASVMDMAEECHSLNNLLDTGAISAGGVAAALNALGSSGDLVLSDLNSRVLELLSNFGQLDDIIASSHRNIENFDWGIDTGEAEDFVTESAEKWNELYKNGEVGNPQLEAYAKWIMGEDRYIALLSSKNGDLAETMAEVSKTVNLYSDGFEKAWDKLAEGSWEKVNFTDDLKDLGISVSFDNGDWKFEPGKATTDQLQKWLQQALKIGPEMAQAMIEDWSNYSPNFRAERQKNDFEAGLDSYVEQRKGANGNVAITASELDAIVSATGQEKDEVIAAIANKANIDTKQVDILENIDKNTGEYVTDGAVLNKELTQTLGAKGQNGWLAAYQAKDSAGNLMKNTIDIENAMAAAIERGYTAAQAKSMAYESYTNAEQQGKDYYYKGELIEAGQYKTLDQFAARLEEIDQNEQWVTVGQAMADGFLNRMNELEKPETPETPSDKAGEPSTSNVSKGTTIPGVGYVDASGNVVKGKSSQYDNAYAEGLAKNKEIAGQIVEAIKGLFTDSSNKNKPDYQQEKPTDTSDFMNWFLGKDLSDNSEISNSLQEAGLKLQEGSTQIETAASKLEGAASKLETATSNLNQNQSNGLNSSNSNIPKGTSVPGVGFIESNAQSVNGNINVETSEADAKVTELQTKLKELNDLVNQGGTYKLNITGVKDITAAANAAKTLSKNSGTQTIGVKTGKADTSSVDKAKTTIGKTEAKIQVGANVDSAIAAARRAQRTINGLSAKIDVEAHVRKTGVNSITIDGKTVTIKTNASGQHNHGYASAPSFGSAARGHYGQVGPKGKGGLTLTGELGYEIAWLPDENRSMILGANGPQMIDLPGNAVVWDHEQSEQILKQKAIPAGSHSTRPRNPSGGGGGGTSTSTSKTVTKAANDAKRSVTTAAVKVGKVSVWWENIARKTESVQRKADQAYTKFEKYIKSMQATLKTTGTKGGGNNYINNMSKVLGYNQAQYNKANTLLKNLDKSNKKTTIKYKQGKKEKTSKVKLGNYIKYDSASGTYVIDQKKINKIAGSKKLGGKAKAKAIKEEAEKQINERLSKRNKAEDAINKAKEALDKFGEQLYETFFAWENELTKIWNLTQKIAQAESNISRIKSYEELLEKQIATGITSVDNAFKENALANFELEVQQSIDKIVDRQNLLKEQQDAVSKALSLVDERETLDNINTILQGDLNETEKIGYENYAKQLTERINTQAAAQKYLNVTQNADGTLKVEFDTESFENDKLQGLYTGDAAKAIQDYVKELVESSETLNQSYDNLTNDIGSMYDSLSDLQQQWVGYANDLWDISDAESKKEAENMKKLSDSITDSLKNLLDEVKRKLDERRRQEDNAKTEKDISQKQQRLAALRADTSGGHQVEIAQLEKEIADAQQDYQRSLEDQLLDKMQQQADLASEQRERQIELQEKIAEEINNAALVDLWMSDPQKYRDQIYEAFKASNDYDKKPLILQKDLDNQFESMMSGLTTNQKKQEILNTSIENLTGALDLLKQSIENIQKGTSQKTIEQLRKLGLTDDQIRKAGFGIQDFIKAGTTDAKDLKAAGFSVADLKGADYKNTDIQEAGYTIGQFKTGTGITGIEGAKLAKEAGYDDEDIVKAYGTEAAMIGANVSGKVAQKINGTSASEIQSIINKSKTDNAKQGDLGKVQAGKVDINGNKKGGIIKDSHFSAGGKRVGANKGSTLYTADWNEKKGKVGKKWNTFTIDKLTTALLKTYPDAREALIYAIRHSKPGTKLNKNMKSLVATAKIAGNKYKLNNGIYGSIGSNGKIYYNTKDGVQIWDAAAGKLTLDKYNKSNYLQKALKNDTISREYAQVLINKKAYTKKQLQDKGVKKFVTGGLANYTGPAWLDGTPSKPELVLNAKDTKNFLALKDVLARAMNGISNTSNTYGDIMYEININVDKIEKDYDVDRVVDKVKKEIIKGAGYRNVTQVRNFR